MTCVPRRLFHARVLHVTIHVRIGAGVLESAGSLSILPNTTQKMSETTQKMSDRVVSSRQQVVQAHRRVW